jgi:nucleoside-diphosphate-sugar epimerase
VDDLIEGMMGGDDPLQRKPDISLAAKKLNWAPAVNLEEGLKRALAYFKKNCSFLRQYTSTIKSRLTYR